VIFCDLLRRFHEELASILTGHLSDWGMYMRLEDSRSIPDDHRTEGLVVTCLRSVATGLHAAAPAADLVGGVMMAGPVHRSARGPSGRRAPCRGMDLPEASTRDGGRQPGRDFRPGSIVPLARRHRHRQHRRHPRPARHLGKPAPMSCRNGKVSASPPWPWPTSRGRPGRDARRHRAGGGRLPRLP